MALRAFADGSIFAEVSGSTPASVLALHGWGRRGADFGQALEGLDYIAPDLPGFGASPPPDRPTGARGYAHLIEPLLGEVGDRAVLVGHSFGARVAVTLASTRPDLCESLVLTGAPLVRRPDRSRPPLAYRLARFGARYKLIPARTLERMRRRHGSTDYLTATGVMRQVLVATVNESYEHELGMISQPVELVWGADDGEVPLDVAERSLSLLKEAGADVRLRVIEGAGHQLPVEAPLALRAAVEGMLGR
jgi:pimeloyl-ACP methyl ester carboxylesterase